MKIRRTALAGTLESSDVLVEVSPLEGTREITVESVVLAQFGDLIKKTAEEVLDAFEIHEGKISLNDRGALDCTIKARIETALKRAEKEDSL